MPRPVLRTIHKYSLSGTPTLLMLPYYTRVLHLDVQREVPTLWVEVREGIPANNEVRITAIPTGGAVTDDMIHIGSLLLNDGDLVLHYYAQLSLDGPYPVLIQGTRAMIP